MEPLYKEGEVVWVFNWAYLFSNPKVDDVVVFQMESKYLVKRVAQVSKKRINVVGDNEKDSLDSRKFGFINQAQIIGRVLG